MSYVFDPPAVPSLPVTGSDARFPVRRIFCIGRNYADHAREMGATVDRSEPVFFTKPGDAVVADGADVDYPPATGELHHEVEMVVALGSGGRDIAPSQAARRVFGYGVGLDLTRRDLQARAKAGGKPWDTAKAFDQSAPVSALRRASERHPGPGTVLSLAVNGASRQRTELSQMIWSVEAIIAALSGLFTLQPGDLIFTGTPAGVAALQRGDHVEAALGDIATLRTRIV